MRISIITPSYNQGRFLPQCLDSVVTQTGAEFEHIVIDAGSTDNTLDVLSRYPNLIWRSEPDNGMSDGINKGFRQATGEWIMWLNCDDYLLPGALEKVAAFAASHPEADVIHGDCIYVTEHGRIIRRKFDTPVDEWDLLFVGCVIPSTTSFYRRKIIDSGHLLDTDYRNCMDWDYYLRLYRIGYRFKYMPEPLACFRWHYDSTTQKNWKRMIDEGLRCQREHLMFTERPKWLGNPTVLSGMRRLFQCRRIIKRLMIHGRMK